MPSLNVLNFVDRATRVHFVCGKIASGKSTLAQQLSRKLNARLISEDAYLAQRYPGQIQSIQDYASLTERLKQELEPELLALLRQGHKLVLDFPANTPKARAWLKTLADTAQVKHQMHVLQVSDSVCKTRLSKRNALGEHPFQPSAGDFDLFSRYFSLPSFAEGFNTVFYKSSLISNDE
ncbi:ATP-binding protein [Pseudomonas sp. F1_0610]|uniref:AAA family ATPase n=1 Tax=Pseudomonas sp. F1_0610 TaxID=3114284 RepID=UPI0039C00C27